MKKLMLFFCLILIPINIWAVESSDTKKIEKQIYTYQKLKPVRYAFIYNIYGKYETVNLKEIELFVRGEKQDYKISTYGVGTDFEKYMMDGDLISYNTMYLPKSSYVLIDFGKLVEVEEVELKIYVYNNDSEEDGFTVAFNDTAPDIKKKEFYFKEEVAYKLNFANPTFYEVFSFKPNLSNMQKQILNDEMIKTEENYFFPYILTASEIFYEEEATSTKKEEIIKNETKTVFTNNNTKKEEKQLPLVSKEEEEIKKEPNKEKVPARSKKKIIKQITWQEQKSKKNNFNLIPLVSIFIIILVFVKIFLSKKRND